MRRRQQQLRLLDRTSGFPFLRCPARAHTALRHSLTWFAIVPTDWKRYARRGKGSECNPVQRSGRTALGLGCLRWRVPCWPVSTVRGNAATRPESVVKPTCQEHCSTDAIDPKLPFGVLGPNVLRRWLANTTVSPSGRSSLFVGSGLRIAERMRRYFATSASCRQYGVSRDRWAEWPWRNGTI